MNKFFKHVSTVMKHKKAVYKCMKDCGHPLQGLMHDMSKFSHVEFWESVKFYQGTRSPIDAAKEDHGYSDAWFHHRGRNRHHSQYWVDLSFGEVKPCRMPEKYLLELICDGIGAGKTYLGSKWTCRSPLEYYNSRDCKSFYHDETRKALISAYVLIADKGWDYFADYIRNGGTVYGIPSLFDSDWQKEKE